MNTKIVYTIISSESDCYLESMWASIHSLRKYNPDVWVSVLADEPTAVRVRANEKLRQLISNVVVVEMPQDFSPKERSRELKTTVRQHIEGAFLYIDNDTAICDSLSDVDNLKCDIAAVPELHLPLKIFPAKETVLHNMKRIFEEDCSDSDYFFNSGVMFVADSKLTRDFYKRWNENWRYATFVKKFSQDQPPLLKTNKDFGYIITPLANEYNCQVTASVQYLYTAKILHFLCWGIASDESASPFINDALYKQIKSDGDIIGECKDIIENAKSSFRSPSMVIGLKPMAFFFSTTGQIFYQLHRDSKYWRCFLDWIARRINLYYRAKRKLKRILKVKN